jgi:hypothetical protein
MAKKKDTTPDVDTQTTPPVTEGTPTETPSAVIELPPNAELLVSGNILTRA